MAADGKTEKPTDRRRAKAREKGQVARSRELSTSIATAAALGWIATRGRADVLAWGRFYRRLLEQSITAQTLNASLLTNTAMTVMLVLTTPMLGIWLAATLSSLAQGGFLFAPESLAVQPARMHPGKKLGEIFSTSGVSQTLKSLVPFALIVAIVAAQVRDSWASLTQFAEKDAAHLAMLLSQQAIPLAWRCVLVLLCWSVVDYFLQRQHMESELKMSREEIREEFKESEGNPQVKAKIRRMQRQVRRQQMLHAVKQASVVITNPTHFALALEYRDDMAAPVLVAKGLDKFAEQIKQMAHWYEVPVIENPPLARSLYRSAEVGQMIPARLYAAVAEVLAAVYRAQAKVSR